MKPKQDTKVEADKLVRAIKRATRRKFRAEEKIRIVLAGLRGKTVSQGCVVGEACTRMYSTAGARNFWKRGKSA